MGDIATHQTIFEHLEQAVFKPLKTRGRLHGDVRFFELGNYLTDVSQFRDPIAFLNGKIKTFETIRAQASAFVREVFGGTLNEVAGAYCNEVWGNFNANAKFRHIDESSRFSKALADVSLASTIQKFANSHNPDRWFTIQQVKSAFDQFYTAYLPYEHLDFPPYAPEPRHAAASRSRRSDRNCKSNAVPDEKLPRRKTYTYLEIQINNLGHNLHRTQMKGLALRGRRRAAVDLKGKDGADSEWIPFYLELGRASHAFEDFFFHSNFVEHWLIDDALRAFESDRAKTIKGGGRVPVVPAGRAPLFALPRFADWVARQKPDLSMPAIRNIMRRVMQPKDAEAQGSERSYYDPNLYTGDFGERDIFHTILKFVAGKSNPSTEHGVINLALQAVSPQGAPGKYAPAKYVYQQNRRRELTNPYVFARVLQTHRHYIKEGLYKRQLDAAERGSFQIGGKTYEVEPKDRLDPTARKLIEGVLTLDQSVADRHPQIHVQEDLSPSPEEDAKLDELLGDTLPRYGLFGILLTLVRDAQLEYDSYREAQRALDDAKTWHDLRYNSGGSGARIGSHSLLAKDAEPVTDEFDPDDPRLERAGALRDVVARRIAQMRDEEFASTFDTPMRDEARKLAAAMTTYLHRVFLMNSKPVNWDRLLRHIMCAPSEVCGTWINRALAGERVRNRHVTSLKILENAQGTDVLNRYDSAASYVRLRYRGYLQQLINDWNSAVNG